jgi:hypothetical protein
MRKEKERSLKNMKCKHTSHFSIVYHGNVENRKQYRCSERGGLNKL